MSSRFILAILCLVAAAGCFTGSGRGRPLGVAEIAAQNRANLSRLELGMAQSEALALMGEHEVLGVRGEANFRNPLRREHVRDKDGRAIEIVFYFVRGETWEDAPDDALLPLSFHDGELVGRSWAWLERNVHKYGVGLR